MKWQNTIAELLEGTPKSRLGWTGFSTLYSMFLVASVDDKTEMLESMRELIEFAIKTRDEDRWRFAANIIYLSSFLGNTVSS
jgi:Golgi nucleoside diphosphatase